MATVLVTGSTDGLGRRVAERLAARGDAVLLHGRDPDKVERVAREVGAERGYLADLGSLAQVRRLADEVERDTERLDALVNNAGLASPERRESADGHELGFAVNYLAGFALTTRLLALLERSAPSRVVNVSSIGQRAIDFDDVMLERDYDPMRSYAQSKLAQIMFTIELAERLPAGVTAVALHPATLMDTNLVRQTFGTTMATVDEGADAVIHALDLAGPSGAYLNATRQDRADGQAYDPAARRRLWELSEALTAPPG